MAQQQTVLDIPIGVPALYLLNQASIIIDPTVGSERRLWETLAQGRRTGNG